MSVNSSKPKGKVLQSPNGTFLLQAPEFEFQTGDSTNSVVLGQRELKLNNRVVTGIQNSLAADSAVTKGYVDYMLLQRTAAEAKTAVIHSRAVVTPQVDTLVVGSQGFQGCRGHHGPEGDLGHRGRRGYQGLQAEPTGMQGPLGVQGPLPLITREVILPFSTPTALVNGSFLSTGTSSLDVITNSCVVPFTGTLTAITACIRNNAPHGTVVFEVWVSLPNGSTFAPTSLEVFFDSTTTAFGQATDTISVSMGDLVSVQYFTTNVDVNDLTPLANGATCCVTLTA